MTSSRVPSAPNEAVIRGSILRVLPGPEGVGCVWEVEVRETDEVRGQRNFARAHLGKSISLFIPPDFPGSFRAGDRIEARIFFQGDERSGGFFLKDGAVRPLPK
jgi:hypothetical protein